jgi:glycosyltransferase involved in cell wall biosynthesis
MNILHVLSSPGAGGAEVYVRDLALEMVSRGHRVHIMFLETVQNECDDGRFQADFLRVLDEGGVTHSVIGVSARRKVWIGVLKLRKAVRELSIDVVHCHLFYAAAFALFVPNVKVIFTQHSYRLSAPKFLFRLLDIRVSAYVAICRACHTLLNDVCSGRVVQINNAVSPERIRFTGAPASLSGDPSRVKLAFVGRLFEAKNIPFLLTACGEVKDLGFELLIAGDGPDRAQLQELAIGLGIAERVHFLGSILDVPGLLHSSDVFVMSSAWEGLPIALIEATLAGLPTLVTDVGGCSEIVDECQNGYCINPGDLGRYVEKLRELISSKVLRENFSRNAIKHSTGYELSYAVDSHLMLYREVLSR